MFVILTISSCLYLPTVEVGYSKFKGAGDLKNVDYGPTPNRNEHLKHLTDIMDEYLKYHGSGDVKILKLEHRIPMAYRPSYSDDNAAGDVTSVQLSHRPDFQRWGEENYMNGPEQIDNFKFVSRLAVSTGLKYHNIHELGNY